MLRWQKYENKTQQVTTETMTSLWWCSHVCLSLAGCHANKCLRVRMQISRWCQLMPQHYCDPAHKPSDGDQEAWRSATQRCGSFMFTVSIKSSHEKTTLSVKVTRQKERRNLTTELIWVRYQGFLLGLFSVDLNWSKEVCEATLLQNVRIHTFLHIYETNSFWVIEWFYDSFGV